MTVTANKSTDQCAGDGIERFFLKGWLVSDAGSLRPVADEKGFALTRARAGLWGTVTMSLPAVKGDDMAAAAEKTYRALFALLADYPDLYLAHTWNYIPAINALTPDAGDLTEIYHHFNKGRFDAYAGHYGVDAAGWPIPAATAVGMDGDAFTLEFFATLSPPVFLENKSQTPAKNYSRKYGPTPPLFSRGVIYAEDGREVLLSSGTAAIKGEDSLHSADVAAQLAGAIDNLRILVEGAAADFIFADLRLLRIYCRHEADAGALYAQARAIVGPDCIIAMARADICRAELLCEVEGVFTKK